MSPWTVAAAAVRSGKPRAPRNPHFLSGSSARAYCHAGVSRECRRNEPSRRRTGSHDHGKTTRVGARNTGRSDTRTPPAGHARTRRVMLSCPCEFSSSSSGVESLAYSTSASWAAERALARLRPILTSRPSTARWLGTSRPENSGKPAHNAHPGCRIQALEVHDELHNGIPPGPRRAAPGGRSRRAQGCELQPPSCAATATRIGGPNPSSRARH
jgi:hypothetical protein